MSDERARNDLWNLELLHFVDKKTRVYEKKVPLSFNVGRAIDIFFHLLLVHYEYSSPKDP